MSTLPIDLDAESVQFDGKWYSREELAKRIKGMLDSGDYAISRPSQALEQLTATLASLRTLAFRATPELAEALNTAAARQNKTLGAVIRDSLASSLGLPAFPVSGQQPIPPGRRTTDPEMPAAKPRAADPTPPLPVPPNLTPHGAASHPPASGSPGPAGLKAAAPRETSSVIVDRSAMVSEDVSMEDAAGAVDLTGKKTKEDEEAVERRWFGG